MNTINIGLGNILKMLPCNNRSKKGVILLPTSIVITGNDETEIRVTNLSAENVSRLLRFDRQLRTKET